MNPSFQASCLLSTRPIYFPYSVCSPSNIHVFQVRGRAAYRARYDGKFYFVGQLVTIITTEGASVSLTYICYVIGSGSKFFILV